MSRGISIGRPRLRGLALGGARSRPTVREENGFFTIYVLGLCMCMFFVGGLSLDIWRVFTERREVASIADAATLVGAAQLDLDAFKAQPSVIRLDPAAARQRALAYIDKAATDEGIELTDKRVDVVDGQVLVTISRSVDMTLTKVLSPGEGYTITVSSAAEPRVAT